MYCYSLPIIANGINLLVGSSKLNSTSGSSALNASKEIETSHIRVYDISGILSTNNFISESFEVYPNPVSNVLYIRMKNDLIIEKVTVYNNLGQKIVESKETILDVSYLSSGIYFVEVTTNQDKAVKKVIVK